MANHRGGSGNFAEDRERASEAGKKGGQHSGGNFKNDPQRASEAGKKGGKSSHLLLNNALSKIAPKVAVPIPPNVKPPSVRAKSPAPSTKVTATIIKLPFWLKSTLFCTQIRAPATAISPNTTIDAPPITAAGIVWISAPNFGEKPNSMAMTAAATNTSVE